MKRMTDERWRALNCGLGLHFWINGSRRVCNSCGEYER